MCSVPEECSACLPFPHFDVLRAEERLVRSYKQETLRLRPPLGNVYRRTAKDVVLAGVRVLKETIVTAALMYTQVDGRCAGVRVRLRLG